MPQIVNRVRSTIVYPNDNPFLNDAWRPVDSEWDADAAELTVIGEIPKDLNGVYIRNSHVPVHEAIGRYHPYDGDGMLHAMRFKAGSAFFRNRWIRTTGFYAEQAAGRSLWPGIIEPRRGSRRGWGSIGAMKDNAGTDVIVHAGRVLAAMSQCSEPYRLDPETLETVGPDSTWARTLQPNGICSHFKVDEHTQEMVFFNFGEEPPYLNYGVVSPDNRLVHYVPIELPGPRWPHDLGMTEHYTVIHDLPLFFDPAVLAKGGHRLRFYRDLPSRFGVLPRYGSNADIRWFEAQPCYLLHLSNTYEDGDEIVMDGCIQSNPLPDLSGLPQEGYARVIRMTSLHDKGTRMHRWRFNLRTGQTREEDLDDQVTEFPMVSGRHNGRPYRYSYNAIPKKGFWLLDGLKKYDFATGRSQTWMAPEGCHVSEAPFAPRDGSKAEDDGYLISFLTNTVTGKGECAVLDARDITRGPVCRIILPDHVATGAHACWAPESMLAGGVAQ
jgi:carotenoid cleavage dioxygenase